MSQKSKKTLAIEQVKSRLPSGIQLIEDTYTGSYNRCSFIDLEYNEIFSGTIYNVYLGGKRCVSFQNRNRKNPELIKEYTLVEIRNYVLCNKIKTAQHLRSCNPSAYRCMMKLSSSKIVFPDAIYPEAKYTVDELRILALNYTNLSRFRFEQPKAYSAIKTKKMTGSLLSHMRSRNISVDENISAVILDSLLGLSSIRNSKKIIPNNKELDIYYPSLKLAFEYDGLRYHTDIKNQPKDALCEAAGITLIRLKERPGNYTFADKVNGVKDTISTKLDLINFVCDTNYSPDDVNGVFVDIYQVFKDLPTIEEIVKIVSSYTTLISFRKEQKNLYAMLVNTGRLYLVDALERASSKPEPFTELSKEDFLMHVKNKFSKYIDFTKSKEYTRARKYKWLDDVKKFLPETNIFQNNWKELANMSDDELCQFLKNSHSNYSEISRNNRLIHFLKTYKSEDFITKLKKDMGLALPKRKDWNEWAGKSAAETWEYFISRNFKSYNEFYSNTLFYGFCRKKGLRLKIIEHFEAKSTPK